MLKGISEKISPELLHAIMAMGHGDEILFGDGNFPAESQGVPVIHCEGNTVCELLDAILPLFPLDQYSEPQVFLMEKVPGDTIETPIWDEYDKIVHKYEPNAKIGFIERFQYYDRAKTVFAIVATSEKAQYANVILKKGVVKL